MKQKFWNRNAFAVIIASLLMFSFMDEFHQPELSSSMLVEQENGTWLLQIRSAMTAYEYEVHQNYGRDSYKTAEEFNALVVQHVMKNVAITINGLTAVNLQKGSVKLGHETAVAFEVHGMPNTIEKIAFTNSSFKDVHDNQSSLIVLKKGFNKKQFMLDNKNLHTVQLIATKNQFVQQ